VDGCKSFASDRKKLLRPIRQWLQTETPSLQKRFWVSVETYVIQHVLRESDMRLVVKIGWFSSYVFLISLDLQFGQQSYCSMQLLTRPIPLGIDCNPIFQKASASSTSGPSPYLKNAVIELLETEIEYGATLASIDGQFAVPPSVDQSERDLIFQDCWNLHRTSCAFIKCVLAALGLTEGTVRHGMLTASLAKLNLGSILRARLSDNNDYKRLILMFVTTTPQRDSLLQRLRVDEVAPWTPADIESLSAQPWQRLQSYPVLVKAIIDHAAGWSHIQLHELNVCLIQFNQLIYTCARAPLASPVVGGVDAALAHFERCAHMLARLTTAARQVPRDLVAYADKTHHYATLWTELLSEGSTAGYTPYDGYTRTTKHHAAAAAQFSADYAAKVIAPLVSAKSECARFKSKLRKCKHYNVARLNRFVNYMEDLCGLVVGQVVHLVQRWVQTTMGSKLHKYCSAHDVLERYARALRPMM
jgi:hypothetical protein